MKHMAQNTSLATYFLLKPDVNVGFTARGSHSHHQGAFGKWLRPLHRAPPLPQASWFQSSSIIIEGFFLETIHLYPRFPENLAL
jgi:hypothetical protein